MSSPVVPLEPVVKKVFTIKDFKWDTESLGKGTFGKVFACREIKNNYPVAIKVIKKTMLTSDQVLLDLKREIELQSVLIHNNIVILYGFFDNYKYVFIVLELCARGTLLQMLKKQKILDVDRAAYYADCLADALDFCHFRSVIHRDLKPANVLITAKYKPKLADFGCAVHDVNFQRQTLCGTPNYFAPEMLNVSANHTHGSEVDNWALGVLYYECLAGNTPFSSPYKARTFRNIVRDPIQFDAKVPVSAMTVIESLLTVNVAKRMKLDHFRQNSYIREEVHHYMTAHKGLSRNYVIDGRGEGGLVPQ